MQQKRAGAASSRFRHIGFDSRLLKQARVNRTSFSFADFSHSFVKILVNPKGLTAFCALLCKKSSARKILDLKRLNFRVDFQAENAARLASCKADK